MAEKGRGVPLDVPSVAFDRLFLELHDQLPRDTRERFAKLADEMKKLTETSASDAPESRPSSADEAVVRREEGTIEAKKSSADLLARGEVMHVVRLPLIECNLGGFRRSLDSHWTLLQFRLYL